MAEPTISIDLHRIEHNARTLTSLCRDNGISVTGVTKVVCGDPDVAAAMLRGGVSSIGESRMRNVERLKANGINSEYMLLRTPPLSDPDAIVAGVDISLNSELTVIAALSEAALKRGLVHRIMLMLDLGDLREGVLPEHLFSVARDIIELEGVRIAGLGTNLSCYGGVVPSPENMGQLVYYADELERRFNLQLDYISGGNSSSWDLLLAGKMPKRINHLRLGESILLGRETLDRKTLPDTYQDAFTLESDVIELKTKPSMPIGETAQDAFGNTPVFEDRGDMVRAILNIGREDIDIDGITPADSRLSVLGGSSDHLIIDATAAADDIRLGDRLPFAVSYSALLAAMTSAYVEKRIVGQGSGTESLKGVALPGYRSGRAEGPKIGRGLLYASLQRSLKDAGAAIFQSEVEHQPHSDPRQRLALEFRDSFANRQFPVAVNTHSPAAAGVYDGIFGEHQQPGLIIFSAYTDPVHELIQWRSRQDQEPTAGGFKAEHVVLIGARSVTAEQAEDVAGSRIEVFTMEDVDSYGMKEVCFRALRAAAKGTQGLHISLDLSVLDPRECENIKRPLIGGITYREAHLAMETLSLSGLIRSCDINGFADQVEAGQNVDTIVSGLMLSLCGKKILGTRKLFSA